MHVMPRHRLTNYIRTERLRTGLSQSEFGELMGLTGSRVALAELEQRKQSARIVLMAEIIFGRPHRDLFPEMVEAMEHVVLDRAVAMEARLAERKDAFTKRKRAHLTALINRLQITYHYD